MSKPQVASNDLTKFLKLLALTSIASMPFKRQVWLMSKAGFQPAEIADLLDTRAHTVSVRLSELRKSRKGE